MGLTCRMTHRKVAQLNYNLLLIKPQQKQGVHQQFSLLNTQSLRKKKKGMAPNV